MGIYDRATREKVVLASGNIFLNVMGECRALGTGVTVCVHVCLCVCVCVCVCAHAGIPTHTEGLSWEPPAKMPAVLAVDPFLSHPCPRGQEASHAEV